jgi:hypothetical protein
MKQKITLKQRKFVRQVVQSIAEPTDKTTPAEIYKKVYDVKDNTAVSGAGRLMNSDVVQGEIRRELERVYPPQILREHLDKLLQANKSSYFEGRRVGTDPDHGVRLETLRTILKVMGAYKAEGPSVDARSINFYLQPDQLRDLQGIAEALDGINDRLIGDQDQR